MLKAVIFDMDGVIVDSEPMNGKAVMRVLKQNGVEISPAYLQTFIGSTIVHLYKTVHEEFHIAVPIEELIRADVFERQQIVKEEGYIPIPYVTDLIKDLYKHGIKLAIASSSSQNDINAVTKAFGITKYFNKLVSGLHVENPKPAPDIFLKTLKELGVSPNETLVIEDSMNGTLAAKAASIISIGYINKNSGDQDLRAASVLIESFKNVDYSFLNVELRRAHGKPITIATTSRLIVRELTVDDIKDMYEIYKNPDIRKFIDDIDDYLDIEIEKHKAYIKNIYAFYGYGLWGVFSKDEEKLIGRCGISNREIDGHNEIELGYLLDVNHWGYGYAIECASVTLEYAFNTIELPRIVAVIDKLNSRSIKVATAIGMTMEKEIIDRDRPCYLYVIHNKN